MIQETTEVHNMARHSSVSRADRKAQRAAKQLETELQKITAVKSDRWQTGDKLLARAQQHFKLVATLQAENTVTSRRKLRELRDVMYDTDPEPTCKGAWDDDAKKGLPNKRAVIGRDGKHQRIMKGQTARNNQAKGL
jgi:type I restriction-modification system DNA methylase subunit